MKSGGVNGPVTVAIDPNVRVEGNATYADLDELTGPVCAGQRVEAVEPESGLRGPATVRRVDQRRGLIYLDVDWPRFGDQS